MLAALFLFDSRTSQWYCSKARSGTHPSSNPTEFYRCPLRNEIPGPKHSLSSDIDLDPTPLRNFHDVLGSATWAISPLLTPPLRLLSLFSPNKISCSWSFSHAICKVSPFQTYWFNHRPVLLLCPTCIDLCQQVTTRGGGRTRKGSGRLQLTRKRFFEFVLGTPKWKCNSQFTANLGVRLVPEEDKTERINVEGNNGI